MLSQVEQVDSREEASVLEVVPVPGAWQPSLSGPRPFLGAHSIIQAVNAGNYRGPLGEIESKGDWRVDRQHGSAIEMNIQVQRNGVRPPSTIGCLLVPIYLGDLILQSGRGPFHERPRYRELTNSINEGLNRSISSRRPVPGKEKEGKWQILAFRIQGKFSS